MSTRAERVWEGTAIRLARALAFTQHDTAWEDLLKNAHALAEEAEPPRPDKPAVAPLRPNVVINGRKVAIDE